MPSVRILSAQGERPIMVNGDLVSHTDDRMTVHCGGGADTLAAGLKVVVDIDNESGSRRCVVDAVSATGTEIVLRSEATHAADKRDYPRLFAGLPIRFRSVSEDEASAWAEGEPIGGHWAEPDPYMNFSVGGLRFDCEDDLDEGSLIAIELSIGDGSALWRATARVVRIFAAAGDRPSSVAVSFDYLPPGAREALSELTLQIQETLL